MKRERPQPAFPPGAFDLEGAAAYLSCSVDFFDEHVRHELRIIRRGRKLLVPRGELDRWLEREAQRTLDW